MRLPSGWRCLWLCGASLLLFLQLQRQQRDTAAGRSAPLLCWLTGAGLRHMWHWWLGCSTPRVSARHPLCPPSGCMLLDEPHWGPLAWGASWSGSEFVKADGGWWWGGRTVVWPLSVPHHYILWMHVVSSALLDLDRCQWRGGSVSKSVTCVYGACTKVSSHFRAGLGLMLLPDFPLPVFGFLYACELMTMMMWCRALVH